MGSRQTLTDTEILQRARPIFVQRGYAARTKEVAAAIGLSWAAVVLRFGGKWGLFSRAIEDPIRAPADCGSTDPTDLRALLERLGSVLDERWPLRLQFRLATGKPAPDDSELLVDRLTAALATGASRGTVRRDLPPRSLAQLVLTMLVGDVAQRFVGCVETHGPDRASIDGLIDLLRPGETS
jgi:AcrR family transcriptional regulator